MYTILEINNYYQVNLLLSHDLLWLQPSG